MRKQPITTLTVHPSSNDRQINTTLLLSKLKPTGRPLPPLERTGLAVHKNGSRASFRPKNVKSSDGTRHSQPVKGQHAFNELITHNASTQTASRAVKVPNATQHDIGYIESEHTASDKDFDSATKNKTKGKFPAQLRRSHSVNQLSGSSVSSRSTSPSVPPETRPMRSTPQHSASNENSDTTVNEHISAQCTLNRRSSCVRVALERLSPSEVALQLTSGRLSKPPFADHSAVVEGKQKFSLPKENTSKTIASCDSSKVQNVTEQLSSTQPTVRSKSLEQDTIDAHSVKPLEKSSSNHGILGGRGDDEISLPVKSSVELEEKCSPTVSRRSSMVCINC